MIFGMGAPEGIVLAILLLNGWMFGRIASRLGRSGLLYGLLFVVPGVHLISMALLAFGKNTSASSRLT